MIGFESRHLLSVQKDRDIASDEADFKQFEIDMENTDGWRSPQPGGSRPYWYSYKAKTGTQDNRLPPPPSLRLTLMFSGISQ